MVGQSEDSCWNLNVLVGGTLCEVASLALGRILLMGGFAVCSSLSVVVDELLAVLDTGPHLLSA